MKRCLTSSVIREMQIKTKRCYFTPSRIAIIKRWKIASVDKDVEKLKPSFIAGGYVKWCSCGGNQENSLVFRMSVTIWPSNFSSRCIPKRSEIMCSHNNLHMDVYNNSHNSQKVETTEICINWWLDKQNVVWLYNWPY